MKVRPMAGQVLIRVLPPETVSSGGIELPWHRLSAEERMERNHNPEMPAPEIGIVEAIGPWPQKNGLHELPPFPEGAKVVFRPGAGQNCNRNLGERLKLIRTKDLLAVLL